MWLYICTCLVLFNVVKSTQGINPPETEITNGSKQTEAIFADVIKNISRVNNVLQELITNYEQLQKIYQSQENVASAYSDSEIDEIFKSKKENRGIEEEIVTSPTNSDKYAATQMFLSEDNDTDEDEKDSSKNERDSSIEKADEEESGMKKVKPKSLPTTVKTTTLKSISSSESKDSDSSDSISKENVKKTKKIVKSKQISKSTLKVVKPKQPEADLMSIDAHKESKQVTDNTKKPKEVRSKLEPYIQSAVEPYKKKTRYSKVNKKPISFDIQDLLNIMPNVDLDNTKKVKQFMYPESFAPKKIWLDIINKSPIQLEAHNEITLQAVNTSNMRSKMNGKNALIIVTKSKGNLNKERDSNSSDVKNAKKEIETKVLRESYEDACLKVVVRKCFLACKRAVKSVCNEFKCKSTHKSDFKSNSKTECIRQFEGKPSKKTSKLKKRVMKLDRSIFDSNDNDSTFVDVTRGGFLSAACFPGLEPKASSLRNSTTTSLIKQTENFNILRDSFERSCRKISTKKCNNACKGAYEKMCDKNKCFKKIKKAYKKFCKRQCKTAYQFFGSDSGSDSSTDSDKSSDSDKSTDRSDTDTSDTD